MASARRVGDTHGAASEVAALSRDSMFGVVAFHANRRAWTGRDAARPRDANARRVPLSGLPDNDTLLESIVDGVAFEKPVPLPVLVALMVDLWEEQGIFE